MQHRDAVEHDSGTPARSVALPRSVSIVRSPPGSTSTTTVPVRPPRCTHSSTPSPQPARRAADRPAGRHRRDRRSAPAGPPAGEGRHVGRAPAPSVEDPRRCVGATADRTPQPDHDVVEEVTNGSTARPQLWPRAWIDAPRSGLTHPLAGAGPPRPAP